MRAKYASLEGVDLAGVFDPDVARAKILADSLGVAAFASLDDLLGAVDVVTVACPAAYHADAALAALTAGRHVYVEKPLAATEAAAEALVAAADTWNLVLACGHQERIVSAAMGLLDLPEPPVLLESVRRQPWGPRNLDVSCVLDLLVHDIDLVLTMTGARPVTVTANGRTTHGPFLDEVEAEVTLAGGAMLKLAASRIAEARERRMRVVFESGEVVVDFIDRTFVNTTPFPLNPGFAETPGGRDPLGASVAAFIARGARRGASAGDHRRRGGAGAIPGPGDRARGRRLKRRFRSGCGAADRRL